jgi:hypothetical protein
MVPLAAVPSEFAGRVLVAKLGSAGILAEVRGVSPVYPSLLGEPSVWVEAAELADARELITTDVDDELPAGSPAPPARSRLLPTLAAVALVLIVLILAYEVRPGTAAGPPPTSAGHQH